MLHIFPFIRSKNVYQAVHITNKTKRLSFKSGRAMRVTKLIKEDWPIHCFGNNFCFTQASTGV